RDRESADSKENGDVLSPPQSFPQTPALSSMGIYGAYPVADGRLLESTSISAWAKSLQPTIETEDRLSGFQCLDEKDWGATELRD
ncbi:hypothetical protein FRB99_002846, partial [Tulasnella sp. 403]